jgi:hypothetical protein
MQFFSPAQCVGYLAFVLGVAAFLQKSDRRLKMLNSIQGLAYAAHFLLLGNIPASSSSLISGVRSFLAVKYRSPWLAWLIVAVNLAVGIAVVRSGVGWIPVVASCAATLAVFLIQGIPMRLVLLACTFMWLTNNILSHSIGGTMLESTIAVVNVTTMIRMLRALPAKPLAPADGVTAES